MKKTKKMLSLAVSLVLLMQLLIIPSALPISADTAAPGAFREDFTQIASLDDSNWLRQIGEASFGASSQIIDDAGGKVLHVNAYNDHAPGSAPAWGTPGWDEWGEVNLRFGTRNETPDNFKLEYRFKVANTGGHPHLLNWLAAPSGWEGGQIFGYYAGADPNYYLRSAYDVQPEQLRVNANLGNGWNTVIITYYNGVYTMYMNGVEAGSREFGARPNKYLHFKINALDFYLDYVEVSAYDGGGIITGPSAGTFREDFSNGNYPGEHLVTAGTAYGAAASVVDDADVGKALFANTYEPDSGAGTPWFEKNLVFALKEATPKNFKAEVRFKIGDTGGWPQMLICPAGTESGPLFNYRQMDGGFYYFGPQYDTIQNRKDENLKDGGWHTMTITVYEGLYILYINGAEKGRQTNTTLPPGRMTIKASTMDVWFDYVEITDFDGGSPFTNRAVFEDDFSAGTINTDNWGGSYLAGITGSPSGDGNALKLSLSPDLYTVANIATNNITPDDYVLRMKFLMETPYAPGGGGNRFPHFAVTMAGTGIDDNSVRFQNDYGWNYIKFGPDQGPPCLPLNEWHELIIIVNKGSYALYINNEKKGEFTSQRGAGDVLMFAMDMDVYIDKFSIEEYQGNPFSDAFGVSFADKPGHIFHTEEEIKFTLEYYNETNAAVNFDVSYEVKDYKGVIVQNGSLSGLTAPVLGKYSSDVALNIDSMGIFTLTATAETNDEVITKSIEFSRVFPVISNRDDTIFASCAHYGQGKGDLVISPYLQSLGGLSLIRDDCAWAAAEPRNGGGVITIPKSWDDFVDAVFDAGIEPLLIFAYGHQAYDGGGIPYTEAGRAGFVNFATKLVEHFSDTTRRADGKTVRYYEVWNEPNLFNTSFNPTNRSATDYTKLMIETYNAVKKVDPDVMILGGSFAPTSGGIVDMVYLKEMMEAGAWYGMDMLSVHPYTYSDQSTRALPSMVDYVGRAYEMLNDPQYRQPEDADSERIITMWSTELGWPTHLSGPPYNNNRGVSEEVSAALLVRSSVMLMSTGFVDKLIWYDFQNDGNDVYYNEHNFGTIRWSNDPVLPWGAKASYVTQNVIANLLHRAEFVKSINNVTNSGTGQYMYQFKRSGNNAAGTDPGDGKDVLAVWYSSASHTNWSSANDRHISINVGEGAFDVYDMYGNSTRVHSVSGAINVTLSEYPIYIAGTITGDLTTGTVLTDWAAEFKPVYEDGEWYLETVITNIFQTELSGTVSITAPASFAGAALPFAAAADSAAVVKIPVANPGQGLYNITVTAEAEGYNPAAATRATSFLYAQKTTAPISVDGVLNAAEWDGAQLILVDTAGDTRSGTTTAPISGWGGPDDLSMKIMTKWDDDNLYLAIEVKDDIHHQTESGFDIWSGDGIQFSFDPGRADGANSLGYNEMGMALTNSGSTETFRWTAAHGSDGAIAAGLMNAAIVRDEDTKITTYEAAVSWELLLVPGQAAEIGSLFGLSVLANENDGTGRRGWIQYMDGIGGSKAPDLFGDLVLTAAGFTPEAEALRDALEAVSGLLDDVKAVLAKPRGTNITANLWANALAAFVPRLEAFDAAGDAWDGEESVVIDGITFAAADVNNWIVNVKNIYNLLNAIV